MPMSVYNWMIVGLCFLLNFNDGVDVLVVSFAGPHIQAEWRLTNAQLGYVFSAGLAGMTAGCFALAPWGDIIGRRKAFLISLFLISAGMLLVYTSNSYGELLCCRLLTGVGIGGILPNLATVAAEFASSSKRDFAVGAVQGGWPLGAIVTGFAVAYLIPNFGWHVAFLAAGIFSAGLWGIVFFLLPESPVFLMTSKRTSAFQNLKELFAAPYRSNTIILWTSIFFGFITLYTLMSWIPSLAKKSGMSFELANYAGTALNVGAFIGVFVMGIAIARIGVKKVILVFYGTCVYIDEYLRGRFLDQCASFYFYFHFRIFCPGGLQCILSCRYANLPGSYPLNGCGNGHGRWKVRSNPRPGVIWHSHRQRDEYFHAFSLIFSTDINISHLGAKHCSKEYSLTQPASNAG